MRSWKLQGWKIPMAAMLMSSVTACGGSGFLGLGASSNNDENNPRPAPVPTASQSQVPSATTAPSAAPSTPVTVVPPPTTPQTGCVAGKVAVGANVLFLLDNSSSNSATDCPSPVEIGSYAGVPTYRCNGQTARETAVLNSFDSLANLTAAQASEVAVSNVAVVQFPTPENPSDGSRVMTDGWVRSSAGQNNRASLQTALSFTRMPLGATPFGSAVDAAQRMFAGVPNDSRARIAILITDGEPTDNDPVQTNLKAYQLRQQGVSVFTIYVTNGTTRAQRVSAHQQMLAGWEQQSMSGGKHWYATRYADFNTYMSDVVGDATHIGLTQGVTSQTDAKCLDAPGASCARYLVEVVDSSGIANAVQQIIQSNAPICHN